MNANALWLTIILFLRAFHKESKSVRRVCPIIMFVTSALFVNGFWRNLVLSLYYNSSPIIQL